MEAAAGGQSSSSLNQRQRPAEVVVAGPQKGEAKVCLSQLLSSREDDWAQYRVAAPDEQAADGLPEVPVGLPV